MNLSFKAGLDKRWTLLDDRIIYGKKEILLTEIQSVKHAFIATRILAGGINIVVNKKTIMLSYSPKSKNDAEIAFTYIQEHYGDENQQPMKIRLLEIQAQIKSIPYSDAFLARKEIEELPKILSNDESIKSATSGFNDGNVWLIVCTNKRVLMLDMGLLYGLKSIDIPLDKISGITQSKGIAFGNVSITYGGRIMNIDKILNATIPHFIDAVNKETAIYKQYKTSTVSHDATKESAADELLKYKQLLDMGALTEEEFKIKKKELLGL